MLTSTGSFQQLNTAQAKFHASLESVADLKPVNKDRKVLRPQTNSLYVPVKLSDIQVESVIIDVGTGYYVRKSRADAPKHYHGKIEYVRENLEKLQGRIVKK